MVNAERLRLDEADTAGVPWRRWGPYLSERQWGTVREDYGSGDDTWSYFSHEQARSRAYRWGEDGLAGVSDDRQQLCLALGLWNGRDPILKERLFGLTNAEGNHGEDVKECYFYLDATPTSSYLKMLYKYPQGNETNNERVFGSANETPHVKDGIDRAVVHGDGGAVDPGSAGTKAALHYKLMIRAGGSATLRLRLTDTEAVRPGRTATAATPFAGFDELMRTRRGEADQFWADLLAGDLTDDERLVVRQALAGMLWSKQYYALDVERWLAEHGADPLGGGSWLRNHDWRHLIAEDIISMPDTWEYPWFAAWDLAFHAVALAMVDVAFAKQQLGLLLNRRYLHPNGQLPAYEWNFSDVNPPVHAWATLFVYQIEEATTGKADRAFLEGAFQKLMRNFSWWLNRKDADNRNIFQGGFLGLDNIGVFDRSAPLPGGGWIDQADGTVWMALYCQNMMQIALELAPENPVYLEQAQALLENLAWIAAATSHVGPDGISLWDEQDGFFYDVLRRPDGSSVPEFLGPHGIRSVSRWHAEHPYAIKVGGQEYRVGYAPAESDTGMFGGNSNWRGPVWFPINVMLIRALLNLHVFFGDGFMVECPTGSGRQLNLYQVAQEISDRLTGTFLKDADGRRPVYGGQPILQSDPHWRDLVLFYEYFHDDNGAGIGASHQTGWTGTVALLPLLFRGVSATGLRSGGRGAIKRAAAGGRAGAAR